MYTNYKNIKSNSKNKKKMIFSKNNYKELWLKKHYLINKKKGLLLNSLK